jgi:hypothetical protein
MSTSFYDQITREHPAYRAGYRAGHDVGLRVALDIICKETANQDDLEVVAGLNPRTADTARHAYTSARLYDVARVIGAHFRQERTP